MTRSFLLPNKTLNKRVENNIKEVFTTGVSVLYKNNEEFL